MDVEDASVGPGQATATPGDSSSSATMSSSSSESSMPTPPTAESSTSWMGCWIFHWLINRNESMTNDEWFSILTYVILMSPLTFPFCLCTVYHSNVLIVPDRIDVIERWSF